MDLWVDIERGLKTKGLSVNIQLLLFLDVKEESTAEMEGGHMNCSDAVSTACTIKRGIWLEGARCFSTFALASRSLLL